MRSTSSLVAFVIALLGGCTTVFCARISSTVVQLIERGKTFSQAQQQQQQQQQHFVVGNRVKSTVAIHYEQFTVLEGTLGTVVALAPGLGVNWDSFDDLTNAAVIPEEIEKIEDRIEKVEEQFAVGNRVKSTVAIDFMTATVPPGAQGTVVALAPQLGVNWDAFNGLTNAAVFPEQIEKLAEHMEKDEEQFAVGNRVKSTVSIDFITATVSEGMTGTVVALAPQLGIDWDAFDSLTNAAVFPEQIEKLGEPSSNLQDLHHDLSPPVSSK